MIRAAFIKLEARLTVSDLVKLMVNVDRGHWSHLGLGTTTLLYSRGVHSYTSAFDHAMLESQLSVIVCGIRSMSLDARTNSTDVYSHWPVWPILEVQRTLFPALP